VVNERRGRAEGVEGCTPRWSGGVELALHSAIDDLRQGIGCIVFVLGEAGLGKTR
jgi:hypothetical protein